MANFSLKMYSVGFIVPFYDTSDPTGLQELASDVADRYLEWFDVLKVELEQRTYPDQNPIVLFTLVVRVNHRLVRPEQLESDWAKMKEGILEDMDKFLKSRELYYEVIE